MARFIFGTPWIRTYELGCQRRSFSIISKAIEAYEEGEPRVRFAYSPTQSLDLSAARTAILNHISAWAQDAALVLRIEDNGLEKSSRESEEALMEDLYWLGLKGWDEGPDIGGDYGPYRQSERNSLYTEYADKLLESGHVYHCFCSKEELEKMKKIAKLKGLPPIYTGKWANATDEEVHEELGKRTPFTYRFRVPKGGRLKIRDFIRGEVSWNLDTLGDFVIMRSNGQPDYNFCVAFDDATMAISDVIRAENHFPNTPRQALIYKALAVDIPLPTYTDISSIIGPDRRNLSKQHGATSVRQFREMGYLPQAMVHYLAMFGRRNGSLENVNSLPEIVQEVCFSDYGKRSLVFDLTKLRRINGVHLKAVPLEELTKHIGEWWKTSGMLKDSEGPFVEEAVRLLKDRIDFITDSDKVLSNFLSYPLDDTLLSPEGKALIKDSLSEVSSSLLAAYESGELTNALEEGPSGWQKWENNFGKSLKRKGKSLLMPLRVLLTGKPHGPDMASSVQLLYKACTCDIVSPNFGFVTLNERFEKLRLIDWEKQSADEAKAPISSATSTTATCHHRINPSIVVPLHQWKPSTTSSFTRQIADEKQNGVILPLPLIARLLMGN